jgi:hypothetical protein
MPYPPTEIAGRDLSGPEEFRSRVLEGCRPVVLRGLVANWPAVEAARRSTRELHEYLAAFDVGARVEAFLGDRSIAGKYYYAAEFKGFNFERRELKFLEALALMRDPPAAPTDRTVYVGSVPLSVCMPGFAPAHRVSVLPANVPARIWLGHPSNVSSHYDAFDNLACVVAGRRRFTLYAPEHIAKLYMGPIDNTMAGPPVSLAASAPPGEADRFPLFEEIRDQALVAELEPGDALYLPKLWWHQVESTAPFNVMINHWWDAFSSGPDAPYTSLLLAMIAIAERPPAERQAWRAFFDHLVFRTHGHPLKHLPAEQHGLLGPLKPDNYSYIRARIMRLLRGD